jgi:hypothetical protein
MSIQDRTARYNDSAYMEGGLERWQLDRAVYPVRAVVIHHTAGFYGPSLGVNATETEELVQLDELATHHRGAWGIGPGYHYAVFPSGRGYAIGKFGTHRAHTKGRAAAWPNQHWNWIALGVVAFGNYQVEAPSKELVATLSEVYDEITTFAGRVPVAIHRAAPTVNASNVSFSQNTLCPGSRLVDALRGEGLWRTTTDGLYVPSATPVTQSARESWDDGYTHGFNTALNQIIAQAERRLRPNEG